MSNIIEKVLRVVYSKFGTPADIRASVNAELTVVDRTESTEVKFNDNIRVTSGQVVLAVRTSDLTAAGITNPQSLIGGYVTLRSTNYSIVNVIRKPSPFGYLEQYLILRDCPATAIAAGVGTVNLLGQQLIAKLRVPAGGTSFTLTGVAVDLGQA